jgi:hypothetical protein
LKANAYYILKGDPMKPSTDKQKRSWTVGLAAASLIALFTGFGMGVDISHSGFSIRSTATREPEQATTTRGLADFVALAKSSSLKL